MVIWKSNVNDEIKRIFFNQRTCRYCLYGCTTWTLTKRMEKKLDGNYKRMLRAMLNKSWRQHLTKQQLYGHLPPITKTIKVRRTSMLDTAGEVGTSSKKMNSCVPLHMDEPRQNDQLEHTYSSSVQIRDVTLKTCRRQWTIERSGERGSRISVLIVRHDDDDEL